MKKLLSGISYLLIAITANATPHFAGYTDPAWDTTAFNTVNATWDFGSLPLTEGTPSGSGISTTWDHNADTSLGYSIYSGFPFALMGGNPFYDFNGSQLDISMPNIVDDLPYKLFNVQISYSYSDNASNSNAPVFIGAQGVESETLIDFVPGSAPTGIIPQQGTNGIYVATFEGVITPNPDLELLSFELAPNQKISGFSVYTISIPEPSSLTLAVFICGSIGFVRRRVIP